MATSWLWATCLFRQTRCKIHGSTESLALASVAIGHERLSSGIKPQTRASLKVTLGFLSIRTIAAAMFRSSCKDRESILNLYKDLIALRRRHKSLVTGRFNTVLVKGDAFIYSRTEGTERIVVALNFGDQCRTRYECEVANSK